MNDWYPVCHRGHVIACGVIAQNTITNSICRVKIGQRWGIVCTKKILRAIPLYFYVFKKNFARDSPVLLRFFKEN